MKKLIALLLLTTSCGASDLLFSSKSECYATCDKQVNCGSLQSSGLNGCQLGCDDQSRGTRACSNEEAIWKAIRDNCTKDKTMCSDAEKVSFPMCLTTEMAKCMR